MLELKYEWLLNRKLLYIFSLAFMGIQMILVIAYPFFKLVFDHYPRTYFELYGMLVLVTNFGLVFLLIIFYLYTLHYDLKHRLRYRQLGLSLWKTMIIRLIGFTLLFTLIHNAYAIIHLYGVERVDKQSSYAYNSQTLLSWLIYYSFIMLNSWSWFTLRLLNLDNLKIFFILFFMSTLLFIGLSSHELSVQLISIGCLITLFIFQFTYYIFQERRHTIC